MPHRIHLHAGNLFISLYIHKNLKTRNFVGINRKFIGKWTASLLFLTDLHSFPVFSRKKLENLPQNDILFALRYFMNVLISM